jgi:hypothetical protein
MAEEPTFREAYLAGEFKGGLFGAIGKFMYGDYRIYEQPAEAIEDITLRASPQDLKEAKDEAINIIKNAEEVRIREGTELLPRRQVKRDSYGRFVSTKKKKVRRKETPRRRLGKGAVKGAVWIPSHMRITRNGTKMRVKGYVRQTAK